MAIVESLEKCKENKSIFGSLSSHCFFHYFNNEHQDET